MNSKILLLSTLCFSLHASDKMSKQSSGEISSEGASDVSTQGATLYVANDETGNLKISTREKENVISEKERQIGKCKRLLARTYQQENTRYQQPGRSAIFGFGDNVPKK